MQPLVSILIPAYKAEHWIADTLRSALDQTWPNKEIIVVDDGSPDGTLAAARQFENQGVKVFTQQNQGAAACRNTALSHARGDFIQWLDADDLLSPNKISAQLAAFQADPDPLKLLSSGWSYFLNRPHTAVFRPTALWRDHTQASWLTCKMGLNLHMQTGTWLTSRELTEKAGPWDVTMVSDDDGEYYCRVLLASKGVRFVPDCGVYYRASGTASVSYIGRSEKKIRAMLKSMKLHIGYLRSLDDSPRARAACLHYMNTWALHFFPDHVPLFEELQQIARELGGELHPPRLSWKYEWIRRCFGWSAARRLQVAAPALKWDYIRRQDLRLARKEGTRVPEKILHGPPASPMDFSV